MGGDGGLLLFHLPLMEVVVGGGDHPISSPYSPNRPAGDEDQQQIRSIFRSTIDLS